MRQRILGLVVTAITFTNSTNLNSQQAPPAVRPEGSGVETLVTRGLQRSATFRDMVTRLENADVVVYVRFARCEGDVPACLTWVTGGSGSRRLLIRLDRFKRSADQLTALLAHELQHATEVASNVAVTDSRSFRELFEARGWKGPRGIETAAADDIERLVQAELFRARGDRRAERTAVRPPH